MTGIKRGLAATLVVLASLRAAEARADDPPAAATPLAARPTRPLTLAPASDGTPVGYKILAGAGIAVAAGLWLRGKRRAQPKAKTTAIGVVGRTSVGMRSELLVVEVEGTRLLVGMTPTTIQTLAVLDNAEPALANEEDEIEEPIRPSLRAPAPRPTSRPSDAALVEGRVKSLLAARGKPASPTPRTSRIAGQAKGLLVALEPDEPSPSDRRRPGT